MNTLEKILEEIEEKIKFAEKIIVKPPCDKLDEIANDTAEAFIEAYKECVEIIRSHMDDVPKCGECSRRKWYQIGYEDAKKEDDWIPVSERLPEPDKMVVVTVHCSEWISDYDSVWVSEDEKIHHSEEYLVSMGYVVNDLGDWAFFDLDGYEIPCDKEFGTDKGDFYSVVTAWRSFEELKPYKGGMRLVREKGVGENGI